MMPEPGTMDGAVSKPESPGTESSRELVERGIEAAQQGEKSRARALLREAVAVDPRSTTGLMWLANLAPDKSEAETLLRQILEIDPGHERARARLRRLVLEPAEVEGWSCPFCRRGSPVRPLRCPGCGAFLSLTSLADFKHDDSLERALILAAVEHLVADAGGDDVASSHRLPRFRRLALAYLNLRDLPRALEALRIAAALQPADAAINSLIDEIDKEIQIDELFPASPPATKAPTSFASGTEKAAPIEVAATAGVVAPAEVIAPAEVAPAVSPPAALAPAPAPELAPATPPPVTDEAPADEEAPRIRVLVVDDSPTVRRMVAGTLTRRGFEVLEASNGMEALAVLNGKRLDLVLLDVTMPHLDGLKVCKVIKNVDVTRDIPVIFLSGKDRFLDKVRGRVAGAVDYLTKPFNPEALLRAIDKHIPDG